MRTVGRGDSAVIEGLETRLQFSTIVWSGSTGPFTSASNWSPAQVPASGDLAEINNGGTAQFTTGTTSVNGIKLGTNANNSGGSIAISGGTLNSGGPNTSGLQSYYGSNLISQTGGVFNTSYFQAYASNGSFTYNLSGGTLETWYVQLGASGPATVNITNGGTFTSSSDNGVYTQSFGIGGNNFGAGAAVGILNLGNASSSGVLNENFANGTVTSLIVRYSAGDRGTLNGWSASPIGFTGSLTNNGIVQANGYGLNRTLDLSDFSSWQQTVPNGLDGTNGWYAVNDGSLVFGSAAVAAGSSTVNVGETAGASLDLVNSLQYAFTGVTGGSVNTSLVAVGSSTIPANTQGTILSAYNISTSGLNYGSGSDTITFRYDHAQASSDGINESLLHVYKWSGSAWVNVTGTVDPADRLITTTSQTAGGIYAIGTDVQIQTIPAGESDWYSGTGNWNNAAGWSPSSVPGSSTIAVIHSGNPVVSTAADSAGSVVTDNSGSLSVSSGGSLSVSNSVTIGSGAGYGNLTLAYTNGSGGGLTTPLLQLGASGGSGTASINNSLTATNLLIGGNASAAASGTLYLGESTETSSIAGSNITVGLNSGSTAVFNGWGSVTDTGTLTNNGQIIANGYGVNRALSLSGFTTVSNSIANSVYGTSGYYAINRGQLVLPNFTVAPASSIVNWGGTAGASPDLVNSVQLSFSGVSGGAIAGSLLSPDRQEFNDVAGSVLDIWNFSSVPGFSMGSGSASLTFRYDAAKAAALGVAESSLQVFKQNTDGTWTNVTGSVNTSTKLITTTSQSSLGVYAIGFGVANDAGHAEFDGPFTSWVNVMNPSYGFGIYGDGVHDDTAGLQKAINYLAASSSREVLYIPAGTYLISSTLAVPSSDAADNPGNSTFLDKSIIGQDPSNTSFKWIGATGQSMVWLDACHTSEFSRITLNGNGLAQDCLRIEHVGSLNLLQSDIEINDVYFQNAQYGLHNTQNLGYGVLDSEVTLTRCTFDNISVAGGKIEGANAYDYWFQYCTFNNCNYGIWNTEGDFKATNCLFENSAAADMWASGFRDGGIDANVSINSNRFMIISGGVIVVQDNRVVNPVQPDAIDIDPYEAQFLDNQFLSNSSLTQGPVIRQSTTSTGGGVSLIGNAFSVTSVPFKFVTPNVLQFANTVAVSGISTLVPLMPVTPPQVIRQVFEVVMQQTPYVANLQAQVTAAANYAAANPGSRPVVHLADFGGSYYLNSTVVVPANAEITIEADGPQSALSWNVASSTTQPDLLFRGPSRVTTIDLAFHNVGASTKADIVIDNADQAGSRILENTPYTTGIQADGLVNTQIVATDSLTESYLDIGGSIAGPSQIEVLNAAQGGSNQTVYTVQNGGQLVARNGWFELTGQTMTVPYAFATGSGAQPGYLDIQSHYIYQGGTGAFNQLVTQNYNGSLALDTASSNNNNNAPDQTLISGTSSATNYLDLLGDSPLASASVTPGQSYVWDTLGVPPTPAQSFILSQLSPLRSIQEIGSPTNLTAGVTDVRMYQSFSDAGSWNVWAAPGVYNLATGTFSSTTTTIPAAPGGLTASAVSSNQINLTWNAVSGAYGYNVYRGTISGGEFLTPINSAPLTGTSFSDAAGLLASTQYYYTVRALSLTAQSLPSTETSASTLAISGPPAAPVGLTASPVSAGQINLSWTPVAGSTGYNLFRATASGTESTTPINAVPITSATYIDSSLSPGTVYFYQVEAVNGNGVSQPSNEVSAQTLSSAPVGVTATALSANQINLSWTAVTGATGYFVYRGITPGAESSTALNSTAVASTSYLDSSLTASTTYYYTVRAVNRSGLSIPSTEAQATTQAASLTPTAWNLTGAGNWNSTANWTNGVPNAVGAEADLFSALTANHTLYTDLPVVVQILRFNNSNTYDLLGAGTLTLQAPTGSTALIDVQTGTQEINLPLLIASNTTLNVDAGATLIIAAPMQVNAGISLTHTGSGIIKYESTVQLLNGATMSLAAAMAIPGLALTAQSSIDLKQFALTLPNADLDTVTSEVQSGAIFSSAALADPARLTTVGVAQEGNSVVARYTYYGDANLDGKVDGSDYSRIDFGYLSHAHGWENGDFNYDGVIDGSDYTLIDNAFNQQGGAISASPAARIGTGNNIVSQNGTAKFAGSVTSSAWSSSQIAFESTQTDTTSDLDLLDEAEEPKKKLLNAYTGQRTRRPAVQIFTSSVLR
jgi:fibronectin type 3 domain-containing protein